MKSILEGDPTNKTVQASKELKGKYILGSLLNYILSHIMNSNCTKKHIIRLL